MLPATSVLATSQRDKNPFIVTTEEYSQNPLSPILYGNFIELGYGLQVEAMYGEMLFNRSFEHFLPYRDINKSWYDLYYDDNDHDKGYEKDWSLFDWYHSGYEYNASHGTSIKYCDTEWLAYNTDVKRDSGNVSQLFAGQALKIQGHIGDPLRGNAQCLGAVVVNNLQGR